MSLAIFDLDNTLISTDSDHAWGEFLVSIGAVDATSYSDANDQFYQDYLNGCLDINAYLEFALSPLANNTPEKLEEWHQQFMEEVIQPHMLDKARQLLQQHREAGDFLLIITATNDFVTTPIAKKLGVDDILASEGERINGRYTGKIKGTPCYQEGKVTRLDEWLAKHPYDLENSYFYSDSHSDIPLLEVVTNPFAVDPDDKLKAHAENRGWPVISLR